MIDRARVAGDRRRPPRPLLFAAVVAAHLAAVWLLLRPSPATIDETASALAVFDVALPPPDPAPPPPPPPPPARRVDDAPRGGGSPGIRRERPAARVETSAPPMREAMDATLAPLAPPASPALPAGTALADLGAGGAGGTGGGTGAGSGPGDGDGSGDGGRGVQMARAEWVRVPSSATYGRYWPVDQRKLARPVIVRLSCSVRRNGRPYRCRVLSETPPRLGFGATALAVLPEARVRPVAKNGAPLWDVPVLITLNFEAIETAPRLPFSAAASAPRAR